MHRLSFRYDRFNARSLRVNGTLQPLLLLFLLDNIGVWTKSEWGLKRVASAPGKWGACA